jgi:hypothetical protein
MIAKKSTSKSIRVATSATSAISQLVGVSQVLPGESESIYQQGLIATVQELGAVTPLQIYLAEKIYECMWWMRRYENQKRATLIRSMASSLDTNRLGGQVSDLEAWVMAALDANQIDEEFNELLQEHNLTLQSLNQKALETNRAQLESLDQMIALKAKTLVGFQASYEVLVNRKVNAERMRLQNVLMQRDLGAIENEAVNAQDRKPTKTPGQ